MLAPKRFGSPIFCSNHIESRRYQIESAKSVGLAKEADSHTMQIDIRVSHQIRIEIQWRQATAKTDCMTRHSNLHQCVFSNSFQVD